MTPLPVSDDLQPAATDNITYPWGAGWFGHRNSLPLRRHVAALAIVLLALTPIVGTQAVWSADEGALLYQATALADGRGWEFDHPLPAADPSGTAFPIHLSSWAGGRSPLPKSGCDDPTFVNATGGCRYVVLAKHTTYLWLVAGLHAIGGYRLVILASTLGTLTAALAAARLARLVDPKADRAALWLAGLASPLLIHGYVAWAHTLAATAVGWGLVLLLTGADQGRRTAIGDVTLLLGGGALLAVACLLRTEASIAGTAVAVGLLAAGRVHRIAGFGRAGVVAGVATTVGTVVDRLTGHPTNGPVEPVAFDQAYGLVAGRLEAFAITWLRPGYGSDPIDLLVMGAAVAVLGAAVWARRGPTTVVATKLALAVACGLLAARLLIAPTALVPGLMMAFPMLFAGLALCRRALVGRPAATAMTTSFVLFCLGVLATQYRGGGGGEWGGRYFALGLPLGVALAAVGLERNVAHYASRDRRVLCTLAGTSMALLSILGVLGVRDVRHQTAGLAARIDEAVTAGLAVDGANPVVVTTIHGTARWMWDDIDKVPWLRVRSDNLAELGGRLSAIGAEPVILVTPTARLSTDSQSLTPYLQATLDQRIGSIDDGWAVVTMIDATTIQSDPFEATRPTPGGVRPSREAPVEGP